MSNGYTGSDSANEAEAAHVEDSLTLNRLLRTQNANESGSCEDCGTDIPPERLKAVPNAACCVVCQSVRDRRITRFVARNPYCP